MLFQVLDWDLRWAKGREELPPLDAKVIPASVRRRLNNFGRSAGCLAADKLENHPLIVFASRYGDVERTVGILDEIARGDTVSPMNFSLSVHNAVAGLLSIGWKLKELQSAISAGADTLTMGITEAISLLTEFPEKEVLLIYVDFPLPTVFKKFDGPDVATSICVALLSRNVRADGHLILTAESTEIDDEDVTNLGDPFLRFEALLKGEKRSAIIGSKAFAWELSRYDA